MELTETDGISEPEAARLIQRAAEIDATDSPLTATQLREVALESGISSAAFERALSEMRTEAGMSREVAAAKSDRAVTVSWKGRTGAAFLGVLLVAVAMLAYGNRSERTTPSLDPLQDATIKLTCLSEGDAAVLARDYLPKGASTLKWNAVREPGILYMHAPAQSISQFKERLAAAERDGATICSVRPSK
ncbi:hypothetical protein [Gemmatimonas sp.]|uniref:hypothetical protein n=1 Tax=Gemmatimonas sp. TaxID=1962908 RepID=UPI0037BF51F1